MFDFSLTRRPGRKRNVPVRVPALVAVLAILLALLAAAATAASGSSKDASTAAQAAGRPNIAALGPVTLTVWDYEQLSTRSKVLAKLNKLFEKKYPNVTIKEKKEDFTSYNATVKLGLSSKNAPDVVEGNQCYSLDNSLVADHLIRPLDPYAKLYGWSDRFGPDKGGKEFRFADQGKVCGQGALYGIAIAGELGGFFYNKQKFAKLGLTIPQTFGEFEADLAKAKAAGEVPTMFGDLDKWPASHLLAEITDVYVNPSKYASIVFGGPTGGKWNIPGFAKSMQTLRQWVQQGYIYKGYAGTSYDAASKLFGEGKGVFLQGGPWLVEGLQKALGKNVGFFLMPPLKKGGHDVALGSMSGPWHITTHSTQPDLAAAYINYITGPVGARISLELGDVPAYPIKAKAPAGVFSDIAAAWRVLTKPGSGNALVPYLDWSTTTVANLDYDLNQELMAGRVTPQADLAQLQKDRDKFYGVK